MVQISEQIRQIAQNVCDRIASLEPAAVAAAHASDRGESAPLSILIDRATDADLQHLLREASRLRSEADAVVAATAGVVAKRSARELGYSGLAKRNGDHNAVDMVQRLTGSTRVEAARQVKLGEAMGEADAATHPAGATTDGSGVGGDGLFGDLDGAVGDGTDNSGNPDDPGEPATAPSARPAPVVPWHEPLTRAVRDRLLKPEAVTIIMRGLGEPNDRVSADDLRISAEQILEDAAGVNADELGRRARFLRDQIDPVGVRLRWDQHFENRTWRFSRSAEGVRTAWIEFDDESAAFIDQLVGAGMRPRRGGPRMVDPAEAERAQRLIDDPRSNDQLVFDLLMATLKAGAEADPNTAFGSRQPGVRIVITKEQFDTRDENGNLTGTGFNEDTGEAIPGNIIERHVCTSGTKPITVDQNNTRSTSAVSNAASPPNNARASPSATAAACSKTAPDPRHTPKPTTSTNGPPKTDSPTSPTASCSAAKTTCSSTTSAGKSAAPAPNTSPSHPQTSIPTKHPAPSAADPPSNNPHPKHSPHENNAHPRTNHRHHSQRARNAPQGKPRAVRHHRPRPPGPRPRRHHNVRYQDHRPDHRHQQDRHDQRDATGQRIQPQHHGDGNLTDE